MGLVCHSAPVFILPYSRLCIIQRYIFASHTAAISMHCVVYRMLAGSKLVLKAINAMIADDCDEVSVFDFQGCYVFAMGGYYR